MTKLKWQDALRNREGREADGNEPLAFCGPALVPDYLGTADGDYLVLKYVRVKWPPPEFNAFVRHLPWIRDYVPGDFSRAALAVIGKEE